MDSLVVQINSNFDTQITSSGFLRFFSYYHQLINRAQGRPDHGNKVLAETFFFLHILVRPYIFVYICIHIVRAGWIKDAGCVWSPEIDLVVVTRIISLEYWERKADALHPAEGSSPGCAIGNVPRIPPGSETRACIHGGSLGTWEVQMLPWVRGRYKEIQPKAKSRR